MHHALRLFLAGISLIVAVPAMTADPVLGSWINPRGSVTVTTAACQDRLCGWVSHANAEALDAEIAGCLAKDWSLERITLIERALLRAGAMELCHMPHLPARAVVSAWSSQRFACQNRGVPPRLAAGPPAAVT